MKFSSLFALLALLVFSTCASAGILNDIQITATDSSGHSATYLIDLSEFQQESGDDDLSIWTYIPADPELYCNEGVCLGKLNSLVIQTRDDPRVNLFFAVEAGASDTTFSISSATVTFPAITNPLAYATASITLTNSNGAVNASLNGLYGGKTYEATYNSPASVFADLISTPITAAPETGTTASDRLPAGSGRLVIPGNVDRIQSHFQFTLSALDQASGTSTFDVIVPEPSTMTLLVLGILGGLAIFKRR